MAIEPNDKGGGKMKKHICCLIFGLFLLCSCDSQKVSSEIPFYVCKRYGAPVSYGEGCHPGIDFEIGPETPIIAATEGKVVAVGDLEPTVGKGSGIIVRVQNAQHFDLIYARLSKVYVKEDQILRRGQLIGLSGAISDGFIHLHFGICKIGGNSQQYSQTFDPNKFWLDGKPQCFDPNADYSNFFREAITLPIACRAYAKELIAAAEQ